MKGPPLLLVALALGAGCSFPPAAGPGPAVVGVWRSVSGLEQFVEVRPLEIRTLTWNSPERCYQAFEYALREESPPDRPVYGRGARTWTLSSDDGSVLVAERRGLGEASTRTYERTTSRASNTC